MPTRTVMIGLDGATFAILNPLIEEGLMPHLGAVIDEGVSGTLESIVPALTPPAWTSIVTGNRPGKHGIFDFFERESVESQSIRLVTSRDIHSETIWSIANRHGNRAIALNFPLMFPPPPIDGYVVPGWMPWKQLRLGCHPTDLYDRIKALPGFDARELAMDMAIEEKALEGCSPDEYADWINLHIHREQQWMQILAMLLEDETPELVTVLFDGVDKIQHLFWRYVDPQYQHTLTHEWEKKTSARCRDYYRQLDNLLGRIFEMTGSSHGALPDVILVSDHGFGAQVRTFHVNAWLNEQGVLAWNQNEAPSSTEQQTLGVGNIARHVYQLDWERTRAYAPLPSGNGIHIVHAAADGGPGVPDGEYEQFRNSLIDGLLALRDPQNGEPVVERVYKREEIFDGPKLKLAPDLTLVLSDGGLISILQSDEIVRTRTNPSGTHRPEGIFIARGPSFKNHAQVDPFSLLNVAPLVLYSLGLPIPEDMHGELPLDVLSDGILASRAPQYVRSSASIEDIASGADLARASNAKSEESDRENEEAVLARLKALGYIE